MFDLHRSKVADWHNVVGKDRNVWQKIAVKSKGIITPANFVSVLGGFLAIYGLSVIVGGETMKGLGFLALGRIADVADGMIADFTRTKSPLGETVDALIDKVVIGLTLVVVGAIELLPWIIVIVIALQNIANVIISVIGKLRNKAIHPSRLGKVSAAFSWTTIILYPLGEWLRQQGHDGSANVLLFIAIASFVVYAVMGLQASLGYGLLIYKKPARKLYRLFK